MPCSSLTFGLWSIASPRWSSTAGSALRDVVTASDGRRGIRVRVRGRQGGGPERAHPARGPLEELPGIAAGLQHPRDGEERPTVAAGDRELREHGERRRKRGPDRLGSAVRVE